MKILGIDPGTAIVGWGCIEVSAQKAVPVSYGAITTPAGTDISNRLERIYTEILKLIDTYRPETVILENLYFSTNAKTAMSVSQARGVILLAAAEKRLPVVSYSPLTVKLSITGDGKAQKPQVQRMVQVLLKLDKIPKPDDTADALAIALTHAYSYKFKEKSV